MKKLHLTLLALLLSFASFATAPITGPTAVCVGGTITLADATPGGTWTSSTPAVLTITSGGVATGLVSGVVVVTYDVSGVDATVSVTVNPLPLPVTGSSAVCVGSNTTLADAGSGLWSSSSPVVATIGSATGIATGIAVGVTTITYSLGTGCSATKAVTVIATPAPITGSSTICAGGTDVLGDVTTGGTWSSTSSTIVTIGAGTGVAVGIAAGVTTISYASSTGCFTTMTVTVEPTPTAYAMTGGGPYCSGASGVHLGLAFSTVGTSYQLYDGSTPVGSSVAGSSSAIDFGLFTTPGTYTVAATSSSTTCSGTMTGSETISISPLPTVYSIGGGGAYCTGGTGVHITLSGSSTGVNYQLYLGGAAVGASLAGTGSVLDFGVYTMAGTYTVVATNPATGCTSNMVGSAIVSVGTLPSVHNVTGGGSYCAGGTGVHIGLDASDAGINYQLYNGTTAVGSPVAGTGSVLDFGLQTAAGTYVVEAINATTGCTSNMTGSATIIITSTFIPTIAITPTPGSTVCTGTSVVFSTTSTGGGSTPTYEWLVNGLAIAGATSSAFTRIPLDGDVITVTMTTSAACATTTSTSTSLTMTVITTSVTATAAEATCGGSYTLTGGGASSYSWSPATGLSCTACGAPVCSGLSSSATYVVTGTDTHGCTGTASVTVNFNRVYGHITYTGGISTDVFKVWLIQFNPSDSSITSLDSVNSCMDAGIPYYEFSSPAAGSYMVKAKLDGTVAGSSGYIPTYSSSTTNWYDAASATHTTGADALDITMVYGTVPSGPGFISGYISAGAGRGTSGDVPAVGMIVYLKDASGHILTYTYTDGTGMYSFSSLANGTYMIYPENYAFYTTPSAVITLTSSNESITGIDFKQHNTSGTITPIDATAVQTVAAQDFNIYPNPATGNLNIQWANKTTGNADVTITDVTGRVVIASTIKINTTSGQSQINVSDLNNGIYLISIKGESVNYNGKVMVQH